VRLETEEALDQARQRDLTILPLVIDDSEVPSSIGEWLFIDFRPGYEAGLKRLLGVVAKRYNVWESGRAEAEEAYTIDHGTEEVAADGRAFVQLDVVSHDREARFCVLSQFMFQSSGAVSREDLGLTEGESYTEFLLKACAREFAGESLRMLIQPTEVRRATFHVTTDDGVRFDVNVRIRRLGEISREALLFNVGALFGQVCAGAGIEL
jgi:hypothetical protein